ncbi:tail fiber domain-containing protein [Paenibacillus tengchongensis]|uniref:tail fiber domain-containing protein n=1 Tax=Paenibacillus tengchongensis TaxID=2608684 RepID=UPI001C9E26D1|nr:tail fiber domain-containing protein [Paenibacillus tengchongensis]
MGKEFKRMNYFDGLFLNAADYSLDQDFYLRLQRLHNRYLHTWGIVTGLKVQALPGKDMQVQVSEGLALNQVVLNGESVSQEILIYEGHPDNPVDLSEYMANESIYIWVSYKEEKSERNVERGQGEPIHTWERGRISHGTIQPEGAGNIVLARVVPRKDGTDTKIDNACIFDYDSDAARTPLRIYAGAAGRKMVTEQLIVKAKSEDNNGNMSDNEQSLAAMPSVYALQEGNVLEVNARETHFTGSLNIKGDLTLEGELYLQGKDQSQSELRIMNSFVEVNSPNPDDPDYVFPGPRDGGLEVYRGSGGTQDARIVWVESEQCFKAGLGTDLKKIAYGNDWEGLIGHDFADSMHKHGKLSSATGASLGYNAAGKLYSDADLALKDDKMLWLKATDKDTIDSTHGLGWFGKGKLFAGAEVDGPALFGAAGGVLGTRAVAADGTRTDKPVLSWNSSGNVGIGPRKTLEDSLDVDGSLRMLSGSNPIRFTSVWSAFPDGKNNTAEISNDTTYHKALMIVGNQSAGQGRKVAIWDRLDVNGMLYVNGSLQASGQIIPSVGNGAGNGIVFPSDPGGGSGDMAWIKYYRREGEDCTLEIGTTNDKLDHISLNASGNVGIGTLLPADKLEVTGGLRIMTGSGQNPIRFTSGWSGFAGGNKAEISNDTGTYGSLMIVGNSANGGARKVSIWDRLDVNTYLQVNGNARITGDLEIDGVIKTAVLNFDGKLKKLDVADNFDAIVRCADFKIGYPGRRGTPGRALVDNGSSLVLNYGNDWSYASVHSSLEVRSALIPSAGSGNNGIIFPSDPGGGSGDSAWIKFYPTSGENCVLDIGVSNDAGDRIYLHASGGVYANGSMYWWSSRELKDNIADLPVKEAKGLLEALNPVSFKYKDGTKERTLGFIAEEVPAILADKDQRAVSAMDIIAVLTSVMKDQQKAITRLQKQMAALQGA